MGDYTFETHVGAEFRGVSPLDIFKTKLCETALKTGQTIYAESVRGYTTTNSEARAYLDGCLDMYHFYSNVDRESDSIDFYLFHDATGFIELQSSDTHIDCVIFGLDSFLVKAIGNIFRKMLSEVPIRGTVHMLAYEQQSYYLVELGEVYSPLERGNYSPSVLEQYDRVIEDLESTVPAGRLTLLNGAPGTGKSFLIRGLVSQVRGLYIYIPASVSGTITGPDIIPLIMREKDKNIPIILLMEDADSSLATRQLDNVSRLSDLLNMSDGILGDMADLRVIATTNSRKDDIDKAVVRDGRMNEYIQLESLEVSHAHQIFLKLVPGKTLQEVTQLFNQKTTLANLYREARRHGWKPGSSPKKKRRQRDLMNYPISPEY